MGANIIIFSKITKEYFKAFTVDFDDLAVADFSVNEDTCYHLSLLVLNR